MLHPGAAAIGLSLRQAQSDPHVRFDVGRLDNGYSVVVIGMGKPGGRPGPPHMISRAKGPPTFFHALNYYITTGSLELSMHKH